MRLLVFALALLVLAGVGCNKQAKEQAASAKQPAAASQDTALPVDPDAGKSPEELQKVQEQKRDEMLKRAGITPEQYKQVVATIIKLAPEYKLEYKAKENLLQPADQVQPPFPLDQIAMITTEKIAGKPDANVEEAVRAILSQVASAQMVAATVIETPPAAVPPAEVDPNTGSHQIPTPSQGGAVSPVTPNSGIPQAPAGEKPFIKAPDVTGEWKSIREEYERHTFNNDDKRYEFMQLFWLDPKAKEQMGAVFFVYRDGKLLSNTSFDYSYDPETAVLKLLDKKTGKVAESYECFMRQGDEKTLYLRSMDVNNPKITVYKYVSRGNKPATAEEEAEYKKVTDMIKRGEKPPKDPHDAK